MKPFFAPRLLRPEAAAPLCPLVTPLLMGGVVMGNGTLQYNCVWKVQLLGLTVSGYSLELEKSSEPTNSHYRPIQ